MAADELQVASLCGSLRKGSFNRGVERALPGLAPEGVRISALDGLAEIPPYNGDIEEAGFPPAVTALGEAVRAADGLVIVTPEYNNSVPGVLKNGIDWLSRLPDQPFSEKPVALISASTGMFGGVRSQIALRPALVTLNAFVMNRPGVFIAQARAKFDPDTIDLTDEPTRDLIARQLAAFRSWIRRLAAD